WRARRRGRRRDRCRRRRLPRTASACSGRASCRCCRRPVRRPDSWRSPRAHTKKAIALGPSWVSRTAMASSSHPRSSRAGRDDCLRPYPGPVSVAWAKDSDADLDAAEALQGDTGLVQDLLDGLLVVQRVRLAEQRGVLEEAVEATLDDLRQGGLGLALGAGGLLGDAALGLDHVGRHVLLGEVLRREGGDVLGDALGDL